MVVHQGLIRFGTSTRFGWGCASAADADRIRSLGLYRKFSFHPNLEHPPSTEVVFIPEAFVGMELEIVQTYPMGFRGKCNASAVRDPVVLAPKMETVQVGVRPVPGDLQGKMQIRQRAVAADQQASPDPRMDGVHPYLELVNLDAPTPIRKTEGLLLLG